MNVKTAVFFQKSAGVLNNYKAYEIQWQNIEWFCPDNLCVILELKTAFSSFVM